MNHLRIVLIHYHLRPGGVTKVVEAQSKILSEHGIDHVILHGGHYDGPAVAERLELLDYNTSYNPQLYEECLNAAIKHLGAPPSIWHLHNPTLGKNAAFPALIHRLASSRIPLLLQIHDFAEDGRSKNYQLLADQTYPVAPQIEYATLNHRDASMLEDVGIEHVSVLPPPVDTHSIVRDPAPKPLLLYPVRGIRRKNIGEAVLISASSRYPVAITLPPRNPEWIPYHNRWRNLAHELRLNIEFSVVDRIAPKNDHDSSYQAWLERCTHIITTSIAEGFGLAFLEPITHQIPILGRDLPEITQDFSSLHGNNLYQALLIPRTWIDAQIVRDSIREQFEENYFNYNRPLTSESFDKLWGYLNRFPNHFDFGDLPEEAQEEVIRVIHDHPERNESILVQRNQETTSLPVWLDSALEHTSPPVEKIKPWSRSAHGENLLDIYQRLQNSSIQAPEWLDKTTLLSHFLTPEKFRILHS